MNLSHLSPRDYENTNPSEKCKYFHQNRGKFSILRYKDMTLAKIRLEYATMGYLGLLCSLSLWLYIEDRARGIPYV